MRILYYVPITHTSRESVISRAETLDVLSQEKEIYQDWLQIAKRICQTLSEDRMGILFMGANHKVIEKLDSTKIKIVNLLEEGGQE